MDIDSFQEAISQALDLESGSEVIDDWDLDFGGDCGFIDELPSAPNLEIVLGFGPSFAVVQTPEEWIVHISDDGETNFLAPNLEAFAHLLVRVGPEMAMEAHTGDPSEIVERIEQEEAELDDDLRDGLQALFEALGLGEISASALARALADGRADAGSLDLWED